MSAVRSTRYWTDYDNENDSVFDQRKVNYIETCKLLGVPAIRSFMQNMTKSYLNLTQYGIGEKAIEGIVLDLKGNVTIASLDLTDNTLGDCGIKTFARVFHSNFNIKRLNVSHNLITDDGAAELLRYLESYNVLEYLNLSGNRITDEIGDDVSRLLKVNKSIKHLNLSKNALEKCGTKIKEGLEMNSVLEVIDLSWNQLRSSSCTAIVTCLATNTCLKTLNLAWNNCEGSLEIGRCLTKNDTLMELNLNYNKITAQGAIDISSGLVSNKSLHILRLQRNLEINPSAIQVLLETLSRSKRLGLITLDLNGILVTTENKATIAGLKLKKPGLDVLVSDFKEPKHHAVEKNILPETWRDDVIKLLSEYMTKHSLRTVELFNRWDIMKKRSLTRIEFSHGIKSCKLSIKKWQMEELFLTFKTDSAGQVHYREFSRLFRQAPKVFKL